jgi:hypothetical protein
MDSQEFADQIGDMLQDNDGLPDDERVQRVQSFREAGLLTNDAGIVVKMANGDEYQITVVKTWSR